MGGPIAGLVLAAGLGSRFRAASGADGPVTKMLALWHGEPMVRRVAATALAAGLDPVVVVVGHARDEVERALAGLDVRFVHNGAFASGLASSVRVGIAAVPDTCEGAVILLGDMPAVAAPALERLVAEFAAAPDAAAVVPVVGGTRGNPVLLARRMFAAVATLSGDRGAAPLLTQAGDAVREVVLTDEALRFDVDTPEALDPRHH